MTSFVRACPICSSTSWTEVLPLAATPLGDALQTNRAAALAMDLYPLSMALCSDCQHAFLPLVVNPEESYSQYFFETGSSPGLSMSMRSLAVDLWKQKSLELQPLVVDIGSNDGSWLHHFKDLGADVLGVEPSSRHAHEASTSGVSTINKFFSSEVAEQIKAEGEEPTLITANFVVANIADLSDFFIALRSLAAEETLIALTTGYHPDQFSVNMFDFVYHEHLSYFTALDFVHLADRFGFRICGTRRVNLKGGSIQVLLTPAQKNDEHHVDVTRLVQYERWHGVREVAWYSALRTRLEEQKLKTAQLLRGLGSRRVLGYGMSHSVTTLLYEFGLIGFIDSLAEDNPTRQGLVSPGAGLPIVEPRAAVLDDFDAVMILAWQHDFLIANRLGEYGWNGPVIQPLPAATLLERRT